MSEQTLKSGFTTGTAMAAAAKAALVMILTKECSDQLDIALPGKKTLSIDIDSVKSTGERSALATVIKDSGDDPDLTHGAKIGAVVTIDFKAEQDDIVFAAGPGVGTITRPGLPLAVGEPAINPGPRRITRRALSQVLETSGVDKAVSIQVMAFAVNGEEIAAKTLNPKLGILGGLSILGTTGIVTPFSHSAYRATIVTELKFAKKAGLERIVFTTGRTTEQLAREVLDDSGEGYIQMGDHVAFSLRQAISVGFNQICVAAMIGKTYKMSLGVGQTRFDAAPMDLAPLGALTQRLTSNNELAERVGKANTCRQALEILTEADALAVIVEVACQAHEFCRQTAGSEAVISFLLFDPDGLILYDSRQSNGFGGERL